MKRLNTLQPEDQNAFLMRVVSSGGKVQDVSKQLEEGIDHYGSQVNVMYNLDFDGKIKGDDKIFEDKGIKILVDKKSILYLLGTTLDFSDGLNGKGFQFINPNASRTCGCGESFAV